MPAPRKRSIYNQSEMFSLTELLGNLDFKLFRELLPRGTNDIETLYYKPEALLKALLLRSLLDLTYRDLETFLLRYESYAKACGFEDGIIPHSSYYCKFFTSIKDTHLYKIVVGILQQLCNYLHITCQVVALDSSVFKAWANSFTKRGDPMAHTGKSSTKGWFFGYKLHMVVDVATELPVALIVTSGNRYDGHELVSLLDQARSNIATDIKAVLADKGYDAGYNYLAIVEDFSALPIIPKRSLIDRYSPQQTTLDQFLPIPPVKKFQTPSCDQKTREKYYRTFPPLSRIDPRWRQLSISRLAIERVFSRFKVFFCPERLHVMGLSRVTKRCLFGWLGMLVSALFLSQHNASHLVRSFPYYV